MSSSGSFAIGEHCFAHVRTHPWWPAVIIEMKENKRKNTNQQLFVVVFFGTKETAILPTEELRSICPDNISKCVTKGALRRKHYKESYEEMMKARGAKTVQIQEPLKEDDMDTFDMGNMDKRGFLSCLGLFEPEVQAAQSDPEIQAVFS